MGSFTLSEILTIVIVILIVFGPKRLPEFARRAGTLVARARAAVDAFKAEFYEEYEEVAAPFRDARDEILDTGRDIGGSMSDIADEVKLAAEETADAAKGSQTPDPAARSGDATGNGATDVAQVSSDEGNGEVDRSDSDPALKDVTDPSETAQSEPTEEPQ